MYAFIRKVENGTDVFGESCEDNTALVLVNRSKEERRQVSADIVRWFKGVMHDLLSEGKTIYLGDGRLDVTLEPLQGKLFIERP